jgi:hypothetical protein
MQIRGRTRIRLSNGTTSRKLRRLLPWHVDGEQSGPGCGLSRKRIASFAGKFWSETAGDANRAGAWRIFKSITFGRAANWVMTRPIILLPFASSAIRRLTDKCTTRKTQVAQGRNS